MNADLEENYWPEVRVIGSSKKIAESKEKSSFYCTVDFLITLLVEMLSEN